MGWFSKLKTVVNVLTLGQSGLIEKQVEIGGKVLKATIDVNNMIVRIGEDIFRAVPGEVFLPGLGPLGGLLKNEVEDELILLNPLGIVPQVTPVINGALVVGRILGVVQHRRMLPDEIAFARKVFGGSIEGLDRIVLTNLSALNGKAFAAPLYPGGYVLSLGYRYDHDDPIDVRYRHTLAHELTHAWQMQRSRLIEIAICRGVLAGAKDELGWDQYGYTPGSQWHTYNTEQQGDIVKNWVRTPGSTPGALAMHLASPLFRYINGNVRTGRNDARTAGDGSVRTFMRESKSHSVRELLEPAFNLPSPPHPPGPDRPPGSHEP